MMICQQKVLKSYKQPDLGGGYLFVGMKKKYTTIDECSTRLSHSPQKVTETNVVRNIQQKRRRQHLYAVRK